MTNTILSCDTMPCGLRHTVKRPTVGEPWTEEYTARDRCLGDLLTLRPSAQALNADRAGWEPLDSWVLVSDAEMRGPVTLREGIEFLRARLA